MCTLPAALYECETWSHIKERTEGRAPRRYLGPKRVCHGSIQPIKMLDGNTEWTVGTKYLVVIADGDLTHNARVSCLIHNANGIVMHLCPVLK